MYKILVVEDEPEAREILKEFISLQGFEVVLAKDGLEGLQKFHEERPKAAIVDLGMPGMNGQELAKTILKENDRFPIIILSGYISKFDVQKILGLGVRAILEKPVNFEEIGIQLHKLFAPST